MQLQHTSQLVHIDSPAVKQPRQGVQRVLVERHHLPASDVQILQMSANEVRFRAQTMLQIGEIVMLAVEDADGRRIWHSPGEIHWSRRLGNALEYGMFLTSRLPDEEVEWTAWERRSELRYPIHVAARLWWDGLHQSLPVVVKNYSSNGIGILCETPAHVGSRFLLATLQDHPEQMVVVQGHCCWQIAHDRGFMIGAELPPLHGRRFSGRSILTEIQDF